jgi:GMP synthase (glutamine-hydrolysing)
MGSLQGIPQKAIAGVIIGGSAANVTEGRPWQAPLYDWVLGQIKKNTPIFGICYGHQLLAFLFGGTLSHMTEKQTGYRRVRVMKDPFLGTGQKTVDMRVSHYQFVNRCPDPMEPWAQSDDFEYDGLRHKDKPIWGLQPHLEATGDFSTGSKVPKEKGDGGFSYMKAFLEYCARD